MLLNHILLNHLLLNHLLLNHLLLNHLLPFNPLRVYTLYGSSVIGNLTEIRITAGSSAVGNYRNSRSNPYENKAQPRNSTAARSKWGIAGREARTQWSPSQHSNSTDRRRGTEQGTRGGIWGCRNDSRCSTHTPSP